MDIEALREAEKSAAAAAAEAALNPEVRNYHELQRKWADLFWELREAEKARTVSGRMSMKGGPKEDEITINQTLGGFFR